MILRNFISLRVFTVYMENSLRFEISLRSNHGTIIRTGITCKKSLVICATQLAGSLLLKMLKYFEIMLNIFEFSHVKEIAES